MSSFKLIVEDDRQGDTDIWSTWSILIMVLFEDNTRSEMSTFKIIESSWLSFTFCSLWLRRLILVVTPLEMEVTPPKHWLSCGSSAGMFLTVPGTDISFEGRNIIW